MLKTPKPFLKAGLIYSSDNGRLICLHCAGSSALWSGRDISGHKVTPMSQDDANEWKRVFGKDLTCEGNCTVHLAQGVTYSPDSAAAMFGPDFGTPVPFLQSTNPKLLSE